MSDSDDNLEIPEEELSEEEKELKKLQESFYSIKLADLKPIEESIPVGYKLYSKRGKDKTSTYLSRAATFISNEIFFIAGTIECLHTFSSYGLVYVKNDADGLSYCVKIPVVQAYHSWNVKTYSGKCQKVWVEGDKNPSTSMVQVR